MHIHGLLVFVWKKGLSYLLFYSTELCQNYIHPKNSTQWKSMGSKKYWTLFTFIVW